MIRNGGVFPDSRHETKRENISLKWWKNQEGSKVRVITGKHYEAKDHTEEEFHPRFFNATKDKLIK